MTKETYDIAHKLYEALKVDLEKGLCITNVHNDYNDCQELVIYMALVNLIK
jgi:hypothetical protein